jgi:hypothetical protein
VQSIDRSCIDHQRAGGGRMKEEEGQSAGRVGLVRRIDDDDEGLM